MKLISNKVYIQFLVKDTVWDTVYTDHVSVRVTHSDFQSKDTGLDTIWVTRVINRVMPLIN